MGRSTTVCRGARIPAQLKRMSRREKRWMQAEIADWQAEGSLTSQWWKARFGEGRRVRMERSWMSMQKTRAPEVSKSLVVARPRPEVPPVMKTTLSLKLSVVIVRDEEIFGGARI